MSAAGSGHSAEIDAPLDARTLRATRDFFRRMDMDEAAEHCEQLALGIDSGVGECEDAECFAHRHSHDPETDESVAYPPGKPGPAEGDQEPT